MAKPDILRNIGLTVAALGIGAAACSDGRSQNQQKNAPKSPTAITEQRRATPVKDIPITNERVRQEVERLAASFPEGSVVRNVYLGDLSTISPVFQNPIGIRVIGPVTYARTHFGNHEYTDQKRFRYALNSDNKPADYATLNRVQLSVEFSTLWQAARTDDVKKIALDKEAYTIAQWEGFSRLMFNNYDSQGTFQQLDPTVTREEVARTVAYSAVIENPQLNKLFDYAGYLPILPAVGELLARNDRTINEDLSASNLITIYNGAKTNNIPFENIAFASREFWDLAYNPHSPWVQYINDPTIPAPEAPARKK